MGENIDEIVIIIINNIYLYSKLLYVRPTMLNGNSHVCKMCKIMRKLISENVSTLSAKVSKVGHKNCNKKTLWHKETTPD